MGTGNTIGTGGKLERKNANSFNSSISTLFNKNKDPYSYGLVLSNNSSDRTITYRPIEDNLSTKVGKAVPLNMNQLQLPSPGEIVPILQGPEQSVGDIQSQYEKITYYLNPVTVKQNVNDNTSISSNGLGGDGSGDVNSYTNNSVGVQDTKKFTKAAALANQLATKEYTKNSLGLSKEATAGLMGNIMSESSFNAGSSAVDNNGAVAKGLIAWNRSSYDSVWDQIPTDAQGQLNFLFTSTRKNGSLITGGVDKWLAEAKANPTGTSTTSTDSELQSAIASGLTGASYFAFAFAYFVERCCGCIKVKQYLDPNGTICHNKGPYRPRKHREGFALDFYKRLNDPNDQLYWG